MIPTNRYLPSRTQSELLNMSKFVVTENFKHHTNSVLPSNYNVSIDAIYEEEMDYLANSQIFAVKTGYGETMGTIRVINWDFITPLPIQKIFGINPLTCIEDKPINEVFHIGRFAIKQGGKGILRKLMVCAIRPVCQHKDNVAFAECDAKLLRTMQLMGIKVTVVGDSINYLGSETIPICMTYDGLIDFYNKNNQDMMIFNQISA